MRLAIAVGRAETSIPPSHRSPQWTLLRYGLIAALTVALSATCCQAARADGYVQVRNLAGALSDSLHLSDLSGSPPANVTNQTYSVIPALGSQAKSVTVAAGYTLDTVINAFGDLSPPFGFAEITAPDNYSILVSYAQIASTNAPNVPVVWSDASGMHFADSNPVDYVSASNVLEVTLSSGSILTVKASTTARRSVASGAPVHFKLDAPVTGQESGESITYQWMFDDGGTSSQPSPTHKYLVAGTYDAYLRVSGSDGSLGFSSIIPITIGKSPKGPNREGGGTNKNKKAPTSGAGSKATKSSADKSTSPAGKSSTTSAKASTSTTTSKTPVKAAASHVSAKRARQTAGPLLRGIAVGKVATSSARPTAPRASARPGVLNPARTGHLTHPSGGLGEGFWIGIVALATLMSGALLEWTGIPRLPRRLRPAVPNVG